MENAKDIAIHQIILPNKQVERKSHDESETTDCQGENNIVEIENTMAKTLSEIKDADQSTISSIGLGEVENLHEVGSINLSDVYSNEKLGHDLLRFIEHGHSLENWQHDSYQDATTSFTSHMQMESVPSEPCISTNMHSTSESTMTLTVLNSQSNDDAAQAISFSFNQLNSNSNNTIDHDYCIYPKSGYSAMEGFHESENNSPFMQPQQEPSMDQEKLLRMKRRKEKNRECSRQFRLKQKQKEQTLIKGKIDKSQELESLKRNVEKMKSSLAIVAHQCCSRCPETRRLLSQSPVVDKENISPEYMQIMK